MKRFVVGLALLVATSLLTAHALAAMSAVNPALTSNAELRPKKVVVLPPQVFVYELTAGGVPTRMADWESVAHANLLSAVAREATANKLFQTVSAPDLDPATRDQLDAHMGLYDRVAQSVFVYGRGQQDAWAHKKNEFDYTVGPGLAFLRERTGADAALIVLGSDFISSSGRKAAFAVGLLLGVGIPLGHAFMTAGLVDLKTGDVLWMSFDSSASLDSRKADDIDALVRAFYQTYPAAR